MPHGAKHISLDAPYFRYPLYSFYPLAILLTPLNSLAGIVGLVLVGVHFLYRKLFY